MPCLVAIEVVGFQLGAFKVFEGGPGVRCRDADLAAVGWAAVFIRHFEEDEVGELFQVIAVADAVVAQGGAEAPDFGNDGIGGHGGGKAEELGGAWGVIRVRALRSQTVTRKPH